MHLEPKACRKPEKTPRGKLKKSFQGFLKMGILPLDSEGDELKATK